ncbi:MAG TPA: hypothetical protein VIM11_05905 [Tepidisphaeraceae bacterium]|jgi:hypothetical protein
MDELQQAVAKLRTLSPKLNSAVEQAQRVVLQVEHFLAHECQLAVQADVPVAYNDKGIAVTLLRYGRVNGKFHIALTQTDGDARFVSRAWVDCDRNEKLASFPALPRLLLAVTKAVESQINSTSATTHTVSSLMSALDGCGIPIEEARPGDSKLELLMRPEEALAAQIGTRPQPRQQQHALPKANPDHAARRAPRKDEAKVG